MNEIKIDKIFKSHRKTIAIEINCKGELIVRCPLQVAESFILAFVNKKKEWILEKQAEIIAKKHINETEEFFFLGNSYPFEIVEASSPFVSLSDKFYIEKPSNLSLNQIMQIWYTIEAQVIILSTVQEKAKQYGLSYNSARISSANRRWGSCNAKKNLNFSYRLVMLPKEVIDYVIIHELAHTVELNHSANYWKVVKEFMPDYKNYERWLSVNAIKFAHL